MEPEDIVPQARIVHDQHFYFADLQLQRALAAVKAIDPPAAGVLFERWRDEGRITPDIDADQRHYARTQPTQHAVDEAAPRQGHRQ